MTFTVLQSVDSYRKDGDSYVFVPKEGVFFTKIISGADSTPATHAYKFGLVEDFNPNDLKELYPKLKRWSKDPHKMAIRYRYTTAKVGDTVVRRAVEVKSVVSSIVAMDVDELPRLSSIGILDIEAQGAYVMRMLHLCDNDIFPKGLGYIVQASSSAGTEKAKNTIKLHIFFENHAGVNQEQLKQFFFDINSKFRKLANIDKTLVDLALYNPVQPHYTSSPIFEAGTPDPFEHTERIVYVRGGQSFIPANIAAYVKPVEICEEEQLAFIGSIEGRDTMPNIVDNWVNMIKSWDPKESGVRTKVIATYHTAWQNSYCLDTLGKELRPYIELIRPGMADEYIRQGRSACIREFVRSSKRELPEKVLGVDIETLEAGNLDLFLDIREPPPENSITFLKASLGTGKTHTIEKWLRRGQIFGKFLTITDTSSLVESNANRFKAGDFRSPKARLEFAMNKLENLSGTLHSLWKIKKFSHDFDFVFIDEADSVLNTLLFSNLISEEKKAMIVDVLHDLFRYSSRVILSDGDLSEESVRQYCDLFEFCKKVYRVNHHRETLKGAVAYQHITEASLWGALQGSLDLGDKCLLVSDCSPDKLNQKKMLLEDLTGGNIKVVHANSKQDKDISEIINQTTDALIAQNVDCLLCSPSITNGVDFNYFDSVYVLTTTDSHTPNLRYQALRRDRGAKIIHFYFNNMKGYTTGYKEVLYNEGWINTSRREIALRRERECKNYINTFQYYLMREGAYITVVNDPYDAPSKDVEKQLKEAYKYEKAMIILEATPHSIKARHNDAYELQQSIRNYYPIEGEITFDDVMFFLDQRPDKTSAFLHQIFADFWTDILRCTGDFEPFRIALERKGAQFYLATGRQARKSKAAAKMYMKQAGILEPGGFEQAIEWYRSYCIIEGHKIPESIRIETEESYELGF